MANKQLCTIDWIGTVDNLVCVHLKKYKLQYVKHYELC